MPGLREVCDDLWSFDCTVRAIPTNGFLKIADSNGVRRAVMGAGLAAQAARRYPNLPEVLGRCIQERGNHVHVLRHDLLAFPTKNDWRNPSELALIEQSAREMLTLTDSMGYTLVALPRVGTGLGGLRWTEVRPVLELVIGGDSRFVVVDNS